ncbi:MAG: DUF1566 domain-containing protein [Deltaproteobacteria bacterium]|nr:DUF1566 domain-containing protein [Deltaproteobacteria bacterium]
MMRATIAMLMCLLAAGVPAFTGCGDDDDGGTDADTDTDTDADTDTDTDTDTDADTDTDTDTDTDADTDTDTDTGTGSDPNLMTDCDGGKLDPATDLCWEDPPAGGNVTWSEATGYCTDLDVGGHDDWRMPLIQELISLLRECQTSECPVTDPDCLNSTCDDDAVCMACDELLGPGTDGCYWSPDLAGSCEPYYWSGSAAGDMPNMTWLVRFSDGDVDLDGIEDADHTVRCVRDES